MRFLSRLRSDDGASMVLVAMSLLLLLGASAVAVDLAAMRLDRSADQKVTDSAASAGALEVLEGTGQDACEAALDYVAINSEGIGSIDTSGCASDIPATCDPTDPRSHSPSSTGRFDVTFHYPVDNNHDLMTSAQLGAPTQTPVAEDGDPCRRVGVEMSATHESLFAQLLGFDQGTTTVHSVALGFLPSVDGPPLNLVVLDRFECQGIRVDGNGGVIVNPVVDPDPPHEVFEGLAASDSSAESGVDCVDEEGEDAGVIHIKGGNPVLRADGPPGCVHDDPLTPTIGEGCGLIQVFHEAAGTPGCNPPACTPGSGGSNPPVPDPTPLPERMTRAQIDYEYNCWPDYTWTTTAPGGVSWATDPLTTANEQNIDGCTEGTPDHIYDRIAAVTPNGRAGHTAWNADEGFPCNVTSGTTYTLSADTWIDCDDFVVEGDVTINGNVIFQGDVKVTSASGALEINSSNGWIVFRGQSTLGTGVLVKDAGADLIINKTSVYFSKTSWVEISGNSSGRLIWTAPDSGDLKDLALWSDSAHTHFWSGQGVLEMVGVFFTPLAKADYSGVSGQNQTNAQWVADKLFAHGQAILEIQPAFDFPFKREDTARTILIR